MLDAQLEYYQCEMSQKLIGPIPEIGFDMGRIDLELAASAKAEAIQCCRSMNLSTDDYSNMRFYINTPYFSRTEDPFTCYNLQDSAVKNIVQIVQNVLGNQELKLNPCLNIIVRCYWDNHTLSFHTDRKEFGEHIYGVVIHNSNPELGIKFKKSKSVMMLDESQPTWCQ